MGAVKIRDLIAELQRFDPDGHIKVTVHRVTARDLLHIAEEEEEEEKFIRFNIGAVERVNDGRHEVEIEVT